MGLTVKEEMIIFFLLLFLAIFLHLHQLNENEKKCQK
jgi:hypothetical protein